MGTVEFDLLQHIHAEDKAARNHETFGSSIKAELIDDLLRGQVVTKERGYPVNLAWILDDCCLIPDSDAAMMLCMSKDERDDHWLLVEKQARAIVEHWVETSDIAAACIAERVRDRVLEASE